MHAESFLQDLAVVLLASGAAALLFHRLGQPKVLGYILAGLFLGPNTPPFSFVEDEATIRVLADLGVIFLMFSLGLEFNFRRFRKVGATAGVSAWLDVTVMVWLGYLLGQSLGWSTVESLFLGGMICDSSTTILAKMLQDLGRTRDKFASVVIGITVVEDVIAVGMVALLTGVAVTGSVQAGMLASRFWTLIAFLVVVAVVGLLTLPRLLDYVYRFENDELLVVSLLGLCFGVTLIAAKMELSIALGAVMVGAIASESRAIQRMEPLVDPLRYMFSAVFFVAIGLMLDPMMLIQHWGPILAVTAAVVIGKFATNTVGAMVTGHDLSTSLRVGAAMAQIGEFAFIIAALGITLRVTADAVYQVGVSAAVLTTLVNPYLMRGADRLALLVEEHPACQRWTNYFHLYGQWIERIGIRSQENAVRRAIRRSLMLIGVNTVLISASIVVVGFVARRPLAVFPALASRPGLLAAGLWLLVMLLCLPLYVATIRKLQAVGMILAEMGLPMTLTMPWARTMRGAIANGILIAGSVALMALTFVLSSAMMPSLEVFLLLMTGTAMIAAWQWPRLVKVYSQAQNAVAAMLQADGGPARGGPATEAGGAPEDLRVETAVMGEGHAMVGKTLRAVGMRPRTGAVVVGIERAGQKIASPGPGERLQAGDRLYLVGDTVQIDQARKWLILGKRGERVAAGVTEGK